MLLNSLRLTFKLNQYQTLLHLQHQIQQSLMPLPLQTHQTLVLHLPHHLSLKTLSHHLLMTLWKSQLEKMAKVTLLASHANMFVSHITLTLISAGASSGVLMTKLAKSACQRLVQTRALLAKDWVLLMD